MQTITILLLDLPTHFILIYVKNRLNIKLTFLYLKTFKKKRKWFKNRLSDPKTYKSYSLKNGKVEKIVVAFESAQTFKGKTIWCECFYFSDQVIEGKLIEKEIAEIRKFYRDTKKPIYLDQSLVDPYHVEKLKKAGFEVDSILLKGKISESLKVIQKKSIELQDGFDIRVPTPKDFQAILKVEIKAHMKEATSIASKFGKKEKDLFSGFYPTLTKEKSLFVIYDDKNRPIAHAAWIIRNKMGHVGLLAFSPDYHGQGLAYILYETLFKGMRKKRFSFYTGLTSTSKVLGFAKKIKRKPCEYTLVHRV